MTKKIQMDKDRQVPIMNVTNGGLIYKSMKTGAIYQFEKYGDIEYIELSELLTMRSSKRIFLDEPLLLIMDEEIVEYLNLTKQYEAFKKFSDINSIFELPNTQFKEIVETSPKGFAHLIVSKAKEKMANGELDSVQKVKVIEEFYKIELEV
ncbi:MAG TPA: hypothetical protein VD651_04155 [Nitrosarchaeum sp.]|nr:hypothetical protein [Nitrosarchaeum sp.]